ncbi:MAG TPA: hypothetical protein VIJ04_19245 [Xanthobacteraceae bacterium]
MRTAFVFVIAIAMVVGGIFFLWGELLWLQHHSIRGIFVIGSVMLVVLGAYLLWTDFVAPIFGIKTWEDQ